MATDVDVVAFEERTLHQDQETHDVVEDHVPRRENDRDDEEDDRTEDGPQLEHGEHHDHETGENTDPEELEEQVLDRPDPLSDLVSGAGLGGQVRRLGVDHGGHDAMVVVTPTR